MTTVAQHFRHPSPSRITSHPKIVMDCGVGIELEIEAIQELNVPGWRCTEDGSLRNGCEMVCESPFGGTRLYRAIIDLSDAVGASSAEGTWRCSTHVHMDMRDADVNVCKKTILAWAFYERMMFKCSGFHRYRSNFCPAFAVVQAQVMNASEAFNYEGSDFYQRLLHRWDKYTSLNLLPLRDFGSMEFRVSEPKWKRTNLLNLVNRYLTLKKLAVDYAALDNDAFVDQLQTLAFEPMLKHLPLDYDIDPSDLEFGYGLARDVLYCRDQTVRQSGRLRVPRDGSTGDMEIPISAIGHFREYLGYIRRNARSHHERFMQTYGHEINGEDAIVTVTQMEAYIEYFRQSGHHDENVTSYIPRVWETELAEFLS